MKHKRRYRGARGRLMPMRIAAACIAGIGAVCGLIAYSVAMVLMPGYTAMATIGLLAGQYIWAEVNRHER